MTSAQDSGSEHKDTWYCTKCGQSGCEDDLKMLEDSGGFFKGCPGCETDAYLSDEIPQGDSVSKHTPTPWSRNIPPASKYNCIFSGRNTHVLYLASRPDNEMEANAAFICRAVNCHDELVEEMEVTANRLARLLEEVDVPEDAVGVIIAQIDGLNAAIAKAKGESHV